MEHAKFGIIPAYAFQLSIRTVSGFFPIKRINVSLLASESPVLGESTGHELNHELHMSLFDAVGLEIETHNQVVDQRSQ